MNCRDRIQNNPYRALGVHVGAPASLELRNKNRIAAYSRVGQQTTFDFPIEEKLTSLERTETSAEEALRTLALPKDRIVNAFFWVGDGNSGWSRELTAAVNSLLDGEQLEACWHYGNLLYDQELKDEFLWHVTHGLVEMSSEDLARILCNNIAFDEEEIISALIDAEGKTKTNKFVKQICGEAIMRRLDDADSFESVVWYDILAGRMSVDFYESYNRLVSKINELIPLVNALAGVYGRESSTCSFITEQIVREIYDKATKIIQGAGDWSWNNEALMRNGVLISTRTRNSLKKSMRFIDGVNACVVDAIDRLHLTAISLRILSAEQSKYNEVLNNVYVTDTSHINKAIKCHRRDRLVKDILWLAILAIIFYLV